MSTQPDDGGPAFPTGFVYEGGNAGGMSLRDYFAAAALGLFSVNENELASICSGVSPRHDIAAKFCYDLADAMLAARGRNGNGGIGTGGSRCNRKRHD